MKKIAVGIIAVFSLLLLQPAHAEEPTIARIRCGEVAAQLVGRGIRVAHGEFGANMLVSLENDGPVTIVLDSKTQFKLSQSD